jgi:hypothetical protein
MADEKYKSDLDHAYRFLAARGVTFKSGMKEDEVLAIEQAHSIVFPPDLRYFLGLGMPTGFRFVNWRGSDSSLPDLLKRPIEGICFDIRENNYWYSGWGGKPSTLESAIDVAVNAIRLAPRLVPVFGNCYVPCDPNLPGNPVFSVHQTDVIHRGENLASYLLWAFRDNQDDPQEELVPVFSGEYRWIPFWSDLAKRNSEWGPPR